MAYRNLKLAFLLLSLGSSLPAVDLFGAGGEPAFGEGPASLTPTGAPRVDLASDSAFLLNELPRTCVDRTLRTGGASWYGPRFHGRKTASGEIYDQYKMTAAMTRMPLGTYVWVVREDVTPRKAVRVKVNDRGPYEKKNGKFVPHSTRVIDLSRAAMTELGGMKSGVIRVTVHADGCP